MRALMMLGGAALLVGPAAAQTSARVRLEGRIPSAIVPVVDSIIGDAAARNLPIEPMIQKALEGGAKGVADERRRRAPRDRGAATDVLAEVIITVVGEQA